MNKLKTALSSRWRDLLIYAILALAIWFPRGLDSDRFVTVDETPWLYRSANFYYAITHGDFGHTSPDFRWKDTQVMAPGVVTMWAETFAFLIEYPEYRGLGQGRFVDPSQFEKFLDTQGVSSLDILATGRQILTVWNTAVLLLAFMVARRLFGLLPAFLGFMFIAFEPYYVALTRIAHLDGPLSGPMLLSALAFIAYIYDGRKMSYLVLSGIAFGVAMLAKLPGVLLVPYVGIMYLIVSIKRWRTQTAEQKTGYFSWNRRLLGHLFIWGGIGLVTLAAFWPEMWVDPFATLAEFLSRPVFHTDILRYVLTGGTSNTVEVANEATNLAYTFRVITSYLWHTTPIIIFGLLGAALSYYRKFGLFVEQKSRRLFIALLLFTVLFGGAINFASTSSNRYFIPMYLPLDLMAAFGWVAIALWSREKLELPIRKYAAPVLLTGVVLVQIFLAIRTHPYYFSYYNQLLGGSQRAGVVFDRGIGLGEGLDQAARYLNNKPDAHSLQVKSWYHIGPFSYIFVGKSRGISVSDVWDEERIADIQRMDYLVTYINQWKRRQPERLIDALDPILPEHIIWINQIEYARIYKVDDLPADFYEYLLADTTVPE